jgi:hypothetical protein
MGHFGVNKTEDVLAAHFFWPKMRRDLTHMAFTYLFLFLVCLGRIFLWTLSYDCLEQRGGVTVFLLLSIISLKWLILYLVTRAIMHHMLLICSSLRLFVYMVFQLLLSWIGMPCG